MIVKKITLAVGFTTLAVFFPPLFTYLGYGSIVSLYINIIAILGIVSWIASKCVFDKWMLLFTCFIALLCVATLIAKNSVSSIIGPYYRLFAFAIMIWMCVRKNPVETLCAIKNILGILVLLNLITLIIAPNGVIQLHREANEWYEYDVPIWLFGNKNAMMNWIIPANFLAQIDYAKNKKSCWNKLIITMTFLTAILAKSSTTLITTGIMSLVFVSRRRAWKALSKIDIKFIMASYLILQLLLFTVNELGIFQIVASLFGKDTTFTGRTTAWKEGLRLIINNPILGYGHMSEERARSLLGTYAFVNAHNTLLNTVLIGGVFAGIVYLFLLWKSSQQIDFSSNA